MAIKAIETVYNGYKFRSRLEARWAVFFDTLGVEYLYEPEGFDLENGIWYLPDFYLPTTEIWIEIKSTKPSEDEIAKARRLHEQSKKIVVIFIGGNFKLKSLWAIAFPGDKNKKILRLEDVTGIFGYIRQMSGVENLLSIGKINQALNVARQARFEHRKKWNEKYTK